MNIEFLWYWQNGGDPTATGVCGGIILFIELALSNDINAACAGAATLVVDTAPQPQTIESRLQQLAELRNKGLIDQKEYASRRTQIIDEV